MIFFIFGAIFGSFCHLLIDRSLRDESIIYPSSHCPNCKKKIKYRDLIPVLSFILLKGKCRNCKNKIPLSYLLFEIGFGIFSLILLGNNPSFERILIFVSLALGFSIAIIDFKSLYIDMSYIYIIFFLGLIYRIRYLGFNFEFFKILLLFSLVFLLIFILSKKSIGDGDYFFYMVLFLFTKNDKILPLILISLWIGALFSIIFAIKERSLKLKIGFCPYIFIGYFLVVVWKRKPSA